MYEKLLVDIGFEPKEATVYETLLSKGPSSASDIAKALDIDRTTVYYMCIRMQQKGFVSELISDGVKTFAATPPLDLSKSLQSRHDSFLAVVPALNQVLAQTSDNFNIHVRSGITGLRFLYTDSISDDGEVLGLGIDDSQYIDIDKTGLDQYYREVAAHDMKERLITRIGARTYAHPNTTYRYLDENAFQPTPTLIYKNKVVFIIWKPTLHVIFIENKELSDSFRKHFELLWKSAAINSKKKY